MSFGMVKSELDFFKYDMDNGGYLNVGDDVVNNVIADHLQKRLQQYRLARTMQIVATKAQAYSIGEDKFGFRVFSDWRGRLYTHAVGVTYQGKDAGKACISAAQGRPLGPRGLYWLGVHIATCQGDTSKASFNERAQWSAERYADGSFQRWISAAVMGEGIEHLLFDEPLQAIVAMADYTAAMRSNDPSAYISSVLCTFDATCSGLQIMAALLRDEKTALEVNVMPRGDGKRADVYLSGGALLMERVKEIAATTSREEFNEKYLALSETSKEINEAKRAFSVADKALKALQSSGVSEDMPEYSRAFNVVSLTAARLESIKSSIMDGTNNLWAHYWIDVGVNRNTVKRPIMVFGYGGKARAMAGYIKSETQGCTWAAAQWLATVLYKNVLPVLLPKAFSLMKDIQALAKVLANRGKAINFTTDNGFVFHQYQNVTEEDSVKIKISKGYVNLAFKEEIDGSIDVNKQVTGSAPNIVHSFDALFLQNVVINAKAKGIDCLSLVHDCFGYMAGDADTMYRILRDTYVETFSGDVIGDLWRKIAREAGAVIADDAVSWKNHIDAIKKDVAKEKYAEKKGKEFTPSALRDAFILPPIPSVGSLDIGVAANSEFIFS